MWRANSSMSDEPWREALDRWNGLCPPKRPEGMTTGFPLADGRSVS
jgi:hypothetical protein